MERERIARAERVEVTTPGIVRGFDAVHVRTTEGKRYVLAHGDSAIPYRTSAHVAVHYDGPSVADSIAKDLDAFGEPWVLRLDRAACHRTPEVRALLRDRRVVALHGPPRCPTFYGQLERQNRDTRAWLDAVGRLDDDALLGELAALRVALNEHWPRRTLSWCTPAAVWASRPDVVGARRDFYDEVQNAVEELMRSSGDEPLDVDVATRWCVEDALMKRGYLKREMGGWC